MHGQLRGTVRCLLTGFWVLEVGETGTAAAVLGFSGYSCVKDWPGCKQYIWLLCSQQGVVLFITEDVT